MLNSEFQICLQLNFLRMSAKMDAVATKLDGAAKTQDISNSIAKTIPQLQKCMKDMSVEDMTGTFYFLKMISSNFLILLNSKFCLLRESQIV